MSQVSRAAPLIVLEGIDGSGKGTQAALLSDRLNASGARTVLLSFPRYQQTFFGARIGEFLDGRFGALDQLDPFLISLLYAGDRLESRGILEDARASAAAVVLDRYVPSNIAHQAAKCDGPRQRLLREWIEQVEYQVYRLPRPELVILLDITTAASQELIRRKQQRAYTDQQCDLQEADIHYLERVRELYLSLAAEQANWKVVPVWDEGRLRDVDEVADEIWDLVRTSLNGWSS